MSRRLFIAMLGFSLRFVSDDAGQFRVGAHALCWIHAERLVHKLVPANDKQRNALRSLKRMIWWFYRALKEYKLAPCVKQAQLLRARFDRIFKRASTGYATLDRCSDGCFATGRAPARSRTPGDPDQHQLFRKTTSAPSSRKEKSPAGPSATRGRDARDIMLWLAKKPA